jgi:hypothetical protein
MFPTVIKNILSNEQINKIIAYINTNINDFGDLNKADYWSGRTLFFHSIKDHEVQQLILSSIKYGYLDLMKRSSEPLYCEHLSIARWPEGYDLSPHADAENPKGSPPHPYPWRDYAMITFLNEDFDGGVLYFPNQKLEIKPKTGYTIYFPGTLEYLHGVTKILKGNRYTIASFLTREINRSSVEI